MVVVRVRDEHGVHAAARPRVNGSHAPEVCYAVAEERVGEEANAVEVDEDGRVSDVFDPGHARER